MRDHSSADPWSGFLHPRDSGTGPSRRGFLIPPQHRPAAAADADLPVAGRWVLDALAARRGPLTVQQIHQGLDLTYMEVTEAVRLLGDRGLVRVRSVDGQQVVRLVNPPG